ncbi:hypothetical protein Pmani_003045 [Petrolisthes manimaculis]|uniref:Methyltransferase domain-containing protein n=1 Tax=Petrolisthes manimaculis TaxID=1843537 RepID=A0AAE1QJB8_9EUCA|nr:hypothetical protein Pmani_003045 [Petrolisthes manimaculis]
MASKMNRNNYFFLILGFISGCFLLNIRWTQSYTTPTARKTIPLSDLSELDLGSEDVPAPAEGGVPAPAEGGVPAPAEGGVPAPAEGGLVAPAEGGVPALAEGVVAPAEGGVPAPAEGGVPAPAEGGVVAPAEGGVPAPAGNVLGPVRDGRVGLSCHQPVTKDGRFYKEVDFAKDDEDWEKKSCSPVLPLPNADEFYNYVETPRLQCAIPAMVGGVIRRNSIDGQKWVCMSKQFKVEPKKCVVMSFGISNDWSFDDEMDKKYKCKVYSFDHTIRKQDHRRSENLEFFSLGLSGTTHTNTKGIVTIDRYINILKKLNLENSIIDYLKIDIEASELSFFKDVLYQTPNLLKNVKMMGIEIHIKAQRANVVVVTKGDQALFNRFISLDGLSPCKHEEADSSRIFTHALHAAKQQMTSVLIKHVTQMFSLLQSVFLLLF